MNALRKRRPLSAADYLAGELHSPVKHEYRDGTAYAMAGARVAHNVIAVNLTSELRTRLRGRACRPYNSDMKVRVRLPGGLRFYYPDASVVCRSNPAAATFQDEPVAVFQVLSASTRRTDEGEKKDAYLTLPSLAAYALFEQDTPTATVYRRTPSGFVREEYEGMAAVLPLGELGIELPLSEVYEAVDFAPEAEGEDGEGE